MQVIETTATSNSVTARVELSNAANVLIVDQTNLNRLQQGANYNYRGGYVTSSPATVTAPATRGQKMYLVVVDQNGNSPEFRYNFH